MAITLDKNDNNINNLLESLSAEQRAKYKEVQEIGERASWSSPPIFLGLDDTQ